MGGTDLPFLIFLQYPLATQEFHRDSTALGKQYMPNSSRRPGCSINTMLPAQIPLK